MLARQTIFLFRRQGALLRALAADTLDNMRAVRMRTLLSLLGVVIGTSAVTALLGMGTNTADEAARQYKAMGMELIAVHNAPVSINAPQTTKILVAGDAESLTHDIHGIAQATPLQTGQAKAGLGTRLLDAPFVGADAGLASVAKLPLAAGRFITPKDAYATVVVLGHGLAQTLAAGPPQALVGRQIRLDNYLYTVVGILQDTAHNPLLPFEVNPSLFVPFKSSRRLELNAGAVTDILVRVADGEDPLAVANRLSKRLSAQGKSAQVQAAAQLVEGLRRQNRLFTGMLGGLGAISLLVGGLGVMNVMLASVAERRKEIGLRMALGARRADILAMIVCEAVWLSLAGGLMGALLGASLSSGHAWLLGHAWSLPLFAMALGLGMSVATGLFFGIYPALQAARLSPIEALR